MVGIAGCCAHAVDMSEISGSSAERTLVVSDPAPGRICLMGIRSVAVLYDSAYSLGHKACPQRKEDDVSRLILGIVYKCDNSTPRKIKVGAV